REGDASRRDAMFVCGWNYGLWPDPVFTPTNIPSLRDGPPDVERLLQTFRPYGTIPSLYDCATNVPSRWDGSYVLRLCYKRAVPLGRFPTFDGLCYTFGPAGTGW